jgi:ubiquinone/menaquinone biosynthesis C-methylase UbiE
MEERKQKEIEYYDEHAKRLLENPGNAPAADFEGFDPSRLASYRFLYGLLRGKCFGRKVLDYGCGNGNHAIYLARDGGEVTAIDLSGKSIAIAEKKAEKNGVGGNIAFMAMDCEKTDFSDNSFDIIFDGGTFSSLDADKAYPELARILKPDGFLVGIETYGHNPLANLNRALNVRSGKRTAWAAAHIFNEAGLAQAGNYFGHIEIYYFHLFSWMAFPLIGSTWGSRLLDFAEIIDKAVIKLPFLKRYAFKVVFKFSDPKK